MAFKICTQLQVRRTISTNQTSESSLSGNQLIHVLVLRPVILVSHSSFLHAVVMVMMAQFFTWPWISFITTLFLYRSHSGAHRSLAYWFSASNHHFIELIKWYSNSSIKKIIKSTFHWIIKSCNRHFTNRQIANQYLYMPYHPTPRT